MIDLNRSHLPCQFLVSVGHSRVIVRGMNRDDAIQQARRLLSQDMPRLYDVIYGLDPTRFQVTPFGPSQDRSTTPQDRRDSADVDC